MNKTLISLCLLCLLGGPVAAYDEAKAKHYADLFAPFADANTPKALAMIMPEKLIELIKSGEPVVMLDVRTPAETKILAIGNPDTLVMQMSEVFKPENLARIPTDKKVLVMCHTGLRSSLISLGLRDLGFANVFTLKGGLAALGSYMDVKIANDPLPAK